MGSDGQLYTMDKTEVMNILNEDAQLAERTEAVEASKGRGREAGPEAETEVKDRGAPGNDKHGGNPQGVGGDVAQCE